MNRVLKSRVKSDAWLLWLWLSFGLYGGRDEVFNSKCKSSLVLYEVNSMANFVARILQQEEEEEYLKQC